MSTPPEPSQPSTNVLLTVAPTGLRERRASAHAPANTRVTLDMPVIPAVPENAILDIEDIDPVKEDVKQPSLIPQIPTLSQLPSLYIDKQSASISGYTPGSLTSGYSGSNAPAAGIRETYFEDAFKSSGNIVDHGHSSDTPRLKRRLALSFFGFFCAGWSDGITGTVLPRFEETYHVDYLTVSLLFVASTVGFAIGTVIIEPLFNGLGRFSLAARHRRYFPVFSSHISRIETGISLSQGRCGVLFFGGLSQAIYFTIAASKAPFPAMIVGFGFSGIGISLLSGQYNAFVAGQKSAGRYLGIPVVPENAILDIEDLDPVKEDVKQPALIPQIPTLSQLPSLYIDKQSASISGYTPGSLTPGYSGSNTPAVARETYFEDAFKSSGHIVDHGHNSDNLRLKRRLALSFFGFFCAGWSDGITGTVLPRFEETYHVDYLTVSLLFVASTVGFAIGTAIIEPLFNGLGQYNAFVASQKSAGRYLGWLHGFYGVGAFASPLVGQTLLARGWEWPRFFIISVCLGCLNTILIVYTFHTTQQEFQEEKAKAIELLRHEPEDLELEERTNDGGETVTPRRPRQRSRSRSAGERSAMRMTLASPIVWIFAIFLCTYTGSETTTGGWIVSFLLKERNADPDTVGYVASGFWGGLAVGRLLLGQMSPYIGLKREKHLVHIYIGIALLMTVLVWKVPLFVGNALCTAIVGFVLGPIFPTSLSLATKLLPAEIHMTALATMSSFASIGSALYPFVTGVLANAKGVAVLQPMMLGILSVMAGLWCFFPTRSIT
ncbi:unnamed protein product [Rhizoctonia solani]|uniref:Major facilitator superfamily (MFS) profile domain-containing protein n=1 Tax=Rhizoctonia solani TaxID=456999 RepID=A0A8H3AHZ8_9AGAM|nr:unnamed protein product [Rhizoctonia solani]